MERAPPARSPLQSAIRLLVPSINAVRGCPHYFGYVGSRRTNGVEKVNLARFSNQAVSRSMLSSVVLAGLWGEKNGQMQLQEFPRFFACCDIPSEVL
jgi:hypothetical protein